MPMHFLSVEQRMAHAYLDTFPAFVPGEGGPPAAEQRAFFDLMRSLYQLAFDEPLLWVPELHEDDAYPNRFNKSSYGKPELLKHMRKFTKEMDALLQALFDMGRSGAVKLSKRQASILARLGIGAAGPFPCGWMWMCTRPGANVTAFARCFFKPDHPYVSDLYARLLGDEPAYRRLENWMLRRGYVRFDSLNATASVDPVSMTYANPAWSPEAPRGGFEYKIRHTGISARYDAAACCPPVVGLCIPGGLKPYLDAFDAMEPRVRRFVADRTKRCDGCRYCVQTDKTGARPLAKIRVAHDGAILHLCPYFPGYNYCWTRLDDALADDLIAMLSFMDGRL